jgi:hypothetical protein
MIPLLLWNAKLKLPCFVELDSKIVMSVGELAQSRFGVVMLDFEGVPLVEDALILLRCSNA